MAKHRAIGADAGAASLGVVLRLAADSQQADDGANEPGVNDIRRLSMARLIQRLTGANRPAYDRGASAVEYALLIAFIAAAIVVGVWAFGLLVNNSFETSCQTVAAQASAIGASCA